MNQKTHNESAQTQLKRQSKPQPMNNHPAVQAIELTKTYSGNVRALNGLSFSVEAGSIFGLLGPNGAGKSTAVKILTTPVQVRSRPRDSIRRGSASCSNVTATWLA